MLIAGNYGRKLLFTNRRNLSILAVILFVLLEEYFIGKIRVSWRSSYLKTVYRPILVHRKSDAPRIAIISVVYDNNKLDEYLLAESTISCYATLNNYTHIKINLQDNYGLITNCPGKDFMFQRHCVVARLMKERENKFDWFLFIDSDMGIVNPDHLIEEYIDPDVDLIFYDRLYNYEIMAGSYLAKNTEFARNFLHKWSLYEHRVKPGSFQALVTDNGAIHEVFLDEFCLNCSADERRHCTRLWADFFNWYDQLFIAESCARNILGKRDIYKTENGTLRQRSNAVGFWARDGWQTDSRWSMDDFIMHGWKTSKLDCVDFGCWISPFTNDNFNMDLCKNPEQAHLNWAYKDSFMKSTNEIRSKLQSIFHQSYLQHLNRAYQAAKLHS